MRGSREISLVPSLHRASTDALIGTCLFLWQSVFESPLLELLDRLKRVREMYTVEPPNKGHFGATFVERSSLSRSSWYDTLLVTLGVALLKLETFLLTLHMNEGSVTEGSVTDDKDVWFLHFSSRRLCLSFVIQYSLSLCPLDFQLPSSPSPHPLMFCCLSNLPPVCQGSQQRDGSSVELASLARRLFTFLYQLGEGGGREEGGEEGNQTQQDNILIPA